MGAEHAYDLSSDGLSNLKTKQMEAAIEKNHVFTIRDIFYADDGKLVAAGQDGERTLEVMTKQFAEVCGIFCLDVSFKKTKAMVTRRGELELSGYHLSVNGQQCVEYVECFPYLGCVEGIDGSMTLEILNRIKKMWSSYAILRHDCFKLKALSWRTKLRVFNISVMAAGLYACEVWNTTTDHIDSMESAQLGFLRSIFGASKKDHLPWEYFLNEAATKGKAMIPVGLTICSRRAGYLGRIKRMPNNHLLKRLLHSSLFSHKPRLVGGQCMNFRSVLKSDLKKLDIQSWQSECLDEGSWSKIVKAGVEKALTTWADKRAVAKEARDMERANVMEFSEESLGFSV